MQTSYPYSLNGVDISHNTINDSSISVLYHTIMCQGSLQGCIFLNFLIQRGLRFSVCYALHSDVLCKLHTSYEIHCIQ